LCDYRRLCFTPLSAYFYCYVASPHDVSLHLVLGLPVVLISLYSQFCYLSCKPELLVLIACSNHLVLLLSKQSSHFLKPNVFLLHPCGTYLLLFPTLCFGGTHLRDLNSPFTFFFIIFQVYDPSNNPGCDMTCQCHFYIKDCKNSFNYFVLFSCFIFHQ
jgi:CO dehydrogenase/acetyl-CoA synthase alpha subunit